MCKIIAFEDIWNFALGDEFRDLSTGLLQQSLGYQEWARDASHPHSHYLSFFLLCHQSSAFPASQKPATSPVNLWIIRRFQKLKLDLNWDLTPPRNPEITIGRHSKSQVCRSCWRWWYEGRMISGWEQACLTACIHSWQSRDCKSISWEPAISFHNFSSVLWSKGHTLNIRIWSCHTKSDHWSF